VLPGIDAKEWNELTDDGVLVRICLDADFTSLFVLHQPRPSTSLDARQCSIEFGLKIIQAAVGLVNGFSKGSGWWLTTSCLAGSEIFPKTMSD
jgi:hypothetical protein